MDRATVHPDQPGNGWGEARLSGGHAAAELIEIEVIGGAGSIVLVLPDGWAVDTDRLAKAWGSKSVKVEREPAPGKPLLMIYGSLGMGSFKVRPANARPAPSRRRDGPPPARSLNAETLARASPPTTP